MNDIIKEFKIVFGIDDKPLQQGIQRTQSSLKGLATSFAKITATYLSYKSLAGLIKSFNDFNTTLENNISIMGYNTEYIATYGNALKRFGGDTNSVISTLNNLNNHLQDVKFGGGALIEVAKKYGVAFMNSNGSLMNAEQLLASLSKQLGKYDRQTRATIASQLGLDEAIQRAFIDGGKDLNNLIKKQRELNLVTSQDLKISNEFNRAMLDLKDSFTYISRLLARTFLPILTNIVKGITNFIDFLKRHKEFVKIFFTTLLIAMTPVLIALGKMAISAVAAFAPFLGVVAVVTAIALVIEDIYGYFKGWDTVTGDLVKKFPALGKALEFLRPLFMGIEATFKQIMVWLKDPTWENFLDIFVKLGNAIIDTVKAPLEYVWGLIKDIVSFISDYIDNKLSIVKDFFSGVVDKIPFIGGNNATNSTTNNNNINVTQNITGNNAMATARASSDMLNNTITTSLTK